MKKVNYDKLNKGDLVQVPRVQFAPMRSGWNGWLFSNAIVVDKYPSKKYKNKNIIVVDMCVDGNKNE